MENKDKAQLHKELESVRRQLSECKASEADKQEQISALLQNQERFNRFIEDFPDPIISYSLDGYIIYVNHKAEEITGYLRDELIGRSITDPLLVSETYLPLIQASLNGKTRATSTAPFELEGISKSGSTFILEVVVVPLSIKGEAEIFVIARDITRKILDNRKSVQLESILRAIRSANTSSDAKKNRELVLQNACDELVSVHHYDNSWIVLFDDNNNLLAGVASGIGHEFKSIIKQIKSGRPPKCVKSTLHHAKVAVIDNPLMDCCDCPLSMLYYEKGCMSIRFKYNNNYGVIVTSLKSDLLHDKEEHAFLIEVAQNLSSAMHSIEIEEERTLIEGALRDSEEKHRQILDNLSEGIWQVDAQEMTTYVNPSMTGMLGYSEKEMLGKCFSEFVRKDDANSVTEMFNRLKKGGKEHCILQLTRKNGSIVYASIATSPILSEDGEYLGFLSGMQDITDRVRIEEALKESEQRYRLLADNASDIMVLMDMTLKPVYFSPSVTQFLGYSVDEALSGSLEDRMTTASVEKALKQFQIGLAKEKRHPGSSSHPTLELEIIHKNGSTVTMEMTVSFIRSARGNITGVLGIMRDVTVRKLAEEELRASEEKYRDLFDHADEGICIAQDSVLKLCNPKTCKITGYSKDELYMKPFIDLVHPEDRELVLSRHTAMINGSKAPHEILFRFVKKSGEIRWAHINTIAIDWEGSKATLNFISDITVNKRTQEALHESEELHRALIESSAKAGIGIVILQSEGDQEAVIVFANDGAIQMSGYSHEEILWKPLSEFIPPDEFLLVLERYRNRQRGKPALPYYETHIISKDGTRVPVFISAATLQYQGKIATVAYFRDITQIKKSEEEVARHAKNMESILTITRMVSQIPTTNTMLVNVLDKVNISLGADKSCIYTLDRVKKRLKMKAYRGLSDTNIRHYSDIPLTETQLLNLQQWKDLSSPYEETIGKGASDRMKNALKENMAHSYIASPLVVKDNVIGILYIVRDKEYAFTDNEIELLTAISFEIAIGLDNAELLEKTVALSLTDELTELYNRRHFYDSLEMEIYRTKRFGQPFSIALLDLNRFKEYNDRYGHSSGDRFLQVFSKALRSSFRKTDIICRYGGDEFSVILPSTDAEAAKTIVERFRNKWATICEKKALIDETPVGFSCGIAKFPDNAGSTDGLIFLADAAMYCAKTGQENGTVMASEMSFVSSDILRAATRDHIYALAATVDAKDPTTHGHSKRVADIAERIGKAIGLPQKELSRIYSAALLHDIGKIGIPDSVLTKPSRPSPEEWTLLKSHSSKGATIVGYVKELSDLAPIVLHHHEYYDGKGYPDGLQGKEIPIGARIISVADAYDNMTTERPYRNLISSQQACEELIKCSGSQFDPTVVKIFCKAIQEAD